MKLSDYKALTFDCYGTLIDWESGIIAGLKPLTDRLKEPLERGDILQAHARCESRQQRWTPACRYRDLLAIVYKRLAEQWSIAVTPDECIRYGQSVEHWQPFADSVAALQYLKAHYALIILSNVDNQSFAAGNEKLQTTFDAIYTAEDIGSYKPSDRNFDYMLEHLQTLGIEKRDILHTAESMFHDHLPAKRHGLDSCWIYRRWEQEGFGATMTSNELPDVKYKFNSMADMVNAHREETASS